MELLVKPLVEIVLPVLATVLTALGALVVQRLQHKFKIEVNEKEQDAIRACIRRAIIGAEEWAARKIGHEKLDRVAGLDKAEKVLSVVRRAYPKLEEAEVLQMIDEEIALIQGLGATMDRVGA